MKLNQKLTVAGTPYKLIDDDIRLRLNMPGKAQFTVQASTKLTGVVVYAAHWSRQQPRNIFIGTVEKSIKKNSREQIIVCRELSAALDRTIPLALRDTTINELLQMLSQKTALGFAVPDQPYITIPMPYFYTLDNGYKTMADIGSVWQIPRYIWQQQPDGRVYVGSREHLPAGVETVVLSDNLLKNFAVDNSAQTGLIPSLRPGMRTNYGVISALGISGPHMDIEWRA